MTSKRELEQHLAQVRDRMDRAESRAAAAAIRLDALGYEETQQEDHWCGASRIEYKWNRTDERIAADREEHLAKVERERERIEQARLEARRETLATVIDALGIKGYAPLSGLYASLMGQGSRTDAALQAEHDELKVAHLDKFWDDLTTALRVRADRAAAEQAAKTEEKVAGLVKREEKPTGGIGKPQPGAEPFAHRMNATATNQREGKK